MDKIIIKEAKFDCSVGVTDKERSKRQGIIVDAELLLDLKKAASTDNIKNTVNYSEVYDLIKKIVEKKECKLIEAIAGNIANGILHEFSVKKVIVRVKKPSALSNKNVEYTAVEVIRKNIRKKHQSLRD